MSWWQHQRQARRIPLQSRAGA